MKRTPLHLRNLPGYTAGEELANAISHTAGFALGAAATVPILLRASRGGAVTVAAIAIYCAAICTLYAMSAIYHWLPRCTGKKVMQVLDHCTIYFLIAGTYTPIAMLAIAPVYPAIGIGLTVFQWALAALAITLTAVDLKKYNVFSMICYIGMGWAVLPFLKQLRQLLGQTGFALLLSGGIAYTIGAILYGIGSKRRWFHFVFHLFVLLGSFLQFLCICFYVL